VEYRRCGKPGTDGGWRGKEEDTQLDGQKRDDDTGPADRIITFFIIALILS
jgi:hypothetical protein